jgi:hypothetical protein
VSDAPAATRGDIGRQWIKAHVLGGIAFNAIAPIAYLPIRWSGIKAGNVSSIELLALAIGLVAAYSLGLAVLGYLSGVALRQKLPLFPLRAWLMLYVSVGVLFGLLASAIWLDETEDFDKLGFGDLLVLAVGLFVVGVGGMLIGVIGGALQAFVLRHTAEGLRTWVVYSAYAGLPIIAFVPSVVYEPASGLAQEVVDAFAGLFATIAGAIIMLPAVHQLRPR